MTDPYRLSRVGALTSVIVAGIGGALLGDGLGWVWGSVVVVAVVFFLAGFREAALQAETKDGEP